MADLNNAMDMYGSTMTPSGRKARRRLQIGDRLADGSKYTGNMRLANYKRQLSVLEEQIKGLMEKYETISADIAEMEKDSEPAEEEVNEAELSPIDKETEVVSAEVDPPLDADEVPAEDSLPDEVPAEIVAAPKQKRSRKKSDGNSTDNA